MEAPEGSVKKLIRIHLNAHKKCVQQRKPNEGCAKKGVALHIHKPQLKSPQVRVGREQSKQNGRCPSPFPDASHCLPKLKTSNLDSARCLSQKILFETMGSSKETHPPTSNSPSYYHNKIKRIKSEQSMAFPSFDSLRKVGRYKVMVRNPFEPKQAKSSQKDLLKQPKTLQLAEGRQGAEVLESSKILNWSGRLSNDGEAEIAELISLL